MEINYDLIISYLVTNNNGESKTKSKPNNFITHKNIFNYSINFPIKFKNILTDKFYRYGITINDNENNNISFWSSVLTLIDKNFIIPYSSDEQELIVQFKTQLIEKYSKSKLSSFIKKLDKNDLRERFKLDQDIYTIQYLVDILDINILIFDWETENIYSVYHKNMMNPWKKTILLAKFKNYWEPIIMIKIKGETEKLFDYNNIIIKKILTTNNLINYFEGDKINKQFILNEDVYSIIHQEKLKTNIKQNDIKQNDIKQNDIKQNDIKQNDIKQNEKLNTNSLDDLSSVKTDTDDLSSVKTDTDDLSSVKTDTDNNTIFINNNEIEELKKLNKSKLNKMKLCELIKLVDKLNIFITKKNPTKSILIDNILCKLK
jgi:hypothetical protein